MQLHVAADRLPDDSPAKTSLARVLDLMGRVIEEGRNAVSGLRSSSGAPGDLEEAFAGIQQELDATAHTEYRVIVEGRPRPLAPMIRDEVYRIGREALANAFRHSGGRNVELELDYAASGVTLLVRDNGRGIDERVLRVGRRRTLGPAGNARACRADWRALQRLDPRRRGHGSQSPRAGRHRLLQRARTTALALAAAQTAPRRRGPRREQGGTTVTDQPRIRVFSVDDHPLLREGLAAIVNSQPDMAMVAQASTGRDAVVQFRDVRPDVTLMDLRLPDISGIDAMIAIRHELPDARIVMLTTFEGDVEIQRALAAGARGYVLKTMPPKELVEVVRQVHAGRKRIPHEVATQLAEHMSDEPLTPREVDVLRHLAGGNRNRDIAARLSISEETVKVHVKHLMEKLGASDRTQAVAIAVRRGIIQL